MARPETVLVVGAGASKDYGYPTGQELKHEVIANTQRGHPIWVALAQLKHEPPRIDEFREALHGSGAPSVDAFLHHRREFLEMGKDAIAAALIPCEKDAELRQSRDGDRWYDFVWQRAIRAGNRQEPDFRSLSIVTFNYDRSLEKYLCMSLRALFSWDLSKIADFLTRYVRLVHVYGSLGTLAEVDPEKGRPYLPDLAAHLVRGAATSLHLVPEDRGGSQAVAQAKYLIDDAARFCFLGFGFDPTNIKLLELRRALQLHPDAEVFATGIGLGTGERKDAEELLGHDVQFGPPEVRTSLDLLKEYRILP